MRKRPTLIGIAGPSCSGKTELAKRLADVLGPRPVTLLSLDSYYRDLSALSPHERERVNFDTPEALDQDLLSQQIRMLVQGEEIVRPVYRFDTHTRAPDGEKVRPKGVIVVEGLFTLYFEAVRRLLDVKVFIEVEDGVCLSRRVSRDIRERGRTQESVVRQYEATVRPMYERYIRPTRCFADVVVRGDDPLEKSVATVLAHVERSAEVGHEQQ